MSISLPMNEFQRHTLATDQKNTVDGTDGLRFPLLGLFGEVGSLLSALKKKLAATKPPILDMTIALSKNSVTFSGIFRTLPRSQVLI